MQSSQIIVHSVNNNWRVTMESIDMGFVEKCESWKLESRFFPSKIGGKPAWLDLKHLPTAKNLECINCMNPCLFLCQIYAPYENNVNAFHRSIYIFICKNDKCCKPNENVNLRVLRSQLPRENDFYPLDPPDERENWRPDISAKNFTQICHICSLLAPNRCAKCRLVNYCCRQHQIIDWKNGHKELCCTDFNYEKCSSTRRISPSQSILFPEFELVIESDTIPNTKNHTDDEEKAEEEMKKYKNMLESGISGTLQFCDDVDDDLVKMATSHEDKAFMEFQNITRPYPDQVLRYSRGGAPLYISSDNQPSDIPKCERCGEQRQFEFQIMPQLLNYLGLTGEMKDLDWGILAIFTCKNSCNLQSEYCPEYIWKQDIL